MREGFIAITYKASLEMEEKRVRVSRVSVYEREFSCVTQTLSCI